MPASRWNSSIIEMLQWLQEQNEFDWEDWMLKPIIPKVVFDEDGQEGGCNTDKLSDS